MTFKALDSTIDDQFNKTQDIPPSVSTTSYVLGQLANLSAQYEFNTL